jgi:peroxin-4
MTELQTYQSDPNEALLELGPADDDVMHWNAVMKGVVGTAYEGTHKSRSLAQSRRVAWR